MAETRAILICPLCGRADGSDVLETRGTGDGSRIRRRRQCHACGQRFGTYERADCWDAERAKAIQAIVEQLREMA